MIGSASRRRTNRSEPEGNPDGPRQATAATTRATTGATTTTRDGTAPQPARPRPRAGPGDTLHDVFTGIVEELGRVVDVADVDTDWGPGRSLVIEASVVLEGSGLGASIAVNGCCLTLVESTADRWTTHASTETLSRTVIGALRPGDPVNLERPMQLGDRLGGHLVLGHVDTTGEIVSPAPDLVVRVPGGSMRYLVEKGSITVDGISLTVFDLTDDTFRVAVIPHTAEVTTLGSKGPGDRVNIEFDVLAKHVERLLEPRLAVLPDPATGDRPG